MPETHSFDFQTQLQISKISSFPQATQSKQFLFDEHKFSAEFFNINKIKINRKNLIFLFFIEIKILLKIIKNFIKNFIKLLLKIYF